MIYSLPIVCFHSFKSWTPFYIYTLSLHDALPISIAQDDLRLTMGGEPTFVSIDDMDGAEWNTLALGPEKRSEEHTSELQSRENLVCRLLLEKKKHPHLRVFFFVPYYYRCECHVGY